MAISRNVPPGAALLLAFISRTETGRSAPDCYDVIYGHNQAKLDRPITSMTLDEVEAAQPGWSRRFGSSAAGAYQFMRNTLDAPKTLRDIEGEMGLTGRERFSPELQDLMAFHLLKRRGYLDFVAGAIDTTAFGNRLAMEWASFPVLSTSLKAAHRVVKRGQSYYAGDGVNKALVAPEEVEAVLDDVLTAATAGEHEPASPAPTDTARPASGGPIGIVPVVILAVLAALVGAALWILGMPPADPAAPLFPAGAPVPLNRPAALLDGFGGGSSIGGAIALEIAKAFIVPLVSAGVTAAVGWVVYWWQKLLKSQFDQRSAEQLHAALERGILAAIDALGARASRASLLTKAADYAETWNSGTVKRFGLTRSDLEQLAAPHLAKVKRGDR